ncbi:Uncharacterised protein [Bordetella holmesii]|nr:Uncharacterised protein [Bordetella holmesii]
MNAEFGAHAPTFGASHLIFQADGIIGGQRYPIDGRQQAGMTRMQYQVGSHRVEFRAVALYARVGHEIKRAKGQPLDARGSRQLGQVEPSSYGFDQREDALFGR